MQRKNAVIASRDPMRTASLTASLNQHFRSVSVARSADEAREAIPRQRAQVAVLDLETVSLADVQHLSREFPAAKIVCIHRLADEKMWVAALGAGATDCCHDGDIRGILSAAVRPQSASGAAA